MAPGDRSVERVPEFPHSTGTGYRLNLEAINEHPYDPDAFYNLHEEGWEQRIGSRDGE